MFCQRKFAIAQTMIEHQACVQQWWRGTPTIQSEIQFIAFCVLEIFARLTHRNRRRTLRNHNVFTPFPGRLHF